MTYLRKILVIVVSLCFVASCTSPRKFEKDLASNNCDSALENIPENQSGYKLISKAQQTGGTLFSYAATGGAYTVQILWDVSVGITAIAVLCAPVIAVMAAANQNHGNHDLRCLPGDITGLLSPPLGEKTYKNTESMRCPAVDDLSISIRKVAKCYLNKGDSESKNKALNTLNSATANAPFFNCLTPENKKAFLDDRTAITSTMH